MTIDVKDLFQSTLTIGYTGSQGTLGYTGSVGYDGSQGNLGYTGSVGYTGSIGDTGFVGSVGYDGSQGNLGYTGSVGYDAGLEYLDSLNFTDESTFKQGVNLEIGVDVQSYDPNLTTWAGKTAPTGDVVGTSDTQTLTSKTLSGVILNDGYTEEVFAVSGTTPALSPANGSIQTWTLTASSTPTAGTWNAGQSIILMIDDGTDYTITWTSLSVTWKTDKGSAPTLNTTGETAISLWKVGTTIYGARVGDA